MNKTLLAADTKVSDQFGDFNTAIGLKSNIGQSTTIGGLINNLGIINIVFFVIGLIFMSSLVMAAVGFINSQGSPEGINKANSRLINSLLGLTITFGAFIIVKLVLSMVGAEGLAPF